MWEFLKTSTDNNDWTPGRLGAGYIHARTNTPDTFNLLDYSVRTWSVGPDYTDDIDRELRRTRPTDTVVFKFLITPTGGIHASGDGFQNLTGRSDRAVIAFLHRTDNKLYDGRDSGKTSSANVERKGLHFNHYTGEPCYCGFGRQQGLGKEANLKYKDIKRGQLPKGYEGETGKLLQDYIVALAEGGPFTYPGGMTVQADAIPGIKKVIPWLINQMQRGNVTFGAGGGNGQFGFLTVPEGRGRRLDMGLLEEISKLFNAEGSPYQNKLVPCSNCDGTGQTSDDEIRAMVMCDKCKGHGTTPTDKKENLLEVDPNNIIDRCRRHTEWAKEREITAMRKVDIENQEKVYEFDDPKHKGWFVTKLNPDADEAKRVGIEQGNCFQSPHQNYMRRVAEGELTVYVLRDEKGLGHGLWAYKPDGTMEVMEDAGRIYGKNPEWEGYHMNNPELREMVSEANMALGLSDVYDRNDEEDNQLVEIQLPDMEDVRDFLSQFSEGWDSKWEWADQIAQQQGMELAEDCQVYEGNVIWDAVVEDLFSYDATPNENEMVKDFFTTLAEQGEWMARPFSTSADEYIARWREKNEGQLWQSAPLEQEALDLGSEQLQDPLVPRPSFENEPELFAYYEEWRNKNTDPNTGVIKNPEWTGFGPNNEEGYNEKFKEELENPWSNFPKFEDVKNMYGKPPTSYEPASIPSNQNPRLKKPAEESNNCKSCNGSGLSGEEVRLDDNLMHSLPCEECKGKGGTPEPITLGPNKQRVLEEPSGQLYLGKTAASDLKNFVAALPVRHSHSLTWVKGGRGRGLFLNDGTLITWPVNKKGEPQHADMYEYLTNTKLPESHSVQDFVEGTPFDIYEDGQLTFFDKALPPELIADLSKIDYRLKTSNIKLTKEFTKEDALDLMDKHNFDFNTDEFIMGMNDELEHEDVTHGDPDMTAKIVADHLREHPDYYTQLRTKISSDTPNQNNLHFNPQTGRPCYCQYGAPKHKNPMERTASDAVRKIKNQGQKIFKTDEGMETLNALNALISGRYLEHEEEGVVGKYPGLEGMVPWIVNQIKKRQINYFPHDAGRPGSEGFKQLNSDLEKTLKFYGIRQAGRVGVIGDDTIATSRNMVRDFRHLGYNADNVKFIGNEPEHDQQPEDKGSDNFDALVIRVPKDTHGGERWALDVFVDYLDQLSPDIPKYIFDLPSMRPGSGDEPIDCVSKAVSQPYVDKVKNEYYQNVFINQGIDPNQLTTKQRTESDEHIKNLVNEELRPVVQEIYQMVENRSDRTISGFPTRFDYIDDYFQEHLRPQKPADVKIPEQNYAPIKWEPISEWFNARQAPTRKGKNASEVRGAIGRAIRTLEYRQKRHEDTGQGRPVNTQPNYRNQDFKNLVSEQLNLESSDPRRNVFDDALALAESQTERTEGMSDEDYTRTVLDKTVELAVPAYKINVMDMDIHKVQTYAAAHTQYLLELEKRERLKEYYEEEEDPNVVYNIKTPGYEDWTVVQLDDSDREQLIKESESLGHCIGEDNMWYREAIIDGRIAAYSLRDPENRPKLTWHFNTDGSLAHVQGKSGDSYGQWRDLVSEFNNAKHFDDDHGGSGTEIEEGEQEPEYIYDWELDSSNTIAHYIASEDDPWGLALEEIENRGDDERLSDDADINHGGADWDEIARDFFYEYNPNTLGIQRFFEIMHERDDTSYFFEEANDFLERQDVKNPDSEVHDNEMVKFYKAFRDLHTDPSDNRFEEPASFTREQYEEFLEEHKDNHWADYIPKFEELYSDFTPAAEQIGEYGGNYGYLPASLDPLSRQRSKVMEEADYTDPRCLCTLCVGTGTNPFNGSPCERCHGRPLRTVYDQVTFGPGKQKVYEVEHDEGPEIEGQTYMAKLTREERAAAWDTPAHKLTKAQAKYINGEL